MLNMHFTMSARCVLACAKVRLRQVDLTSQFVEHNFHNCDAVASE